MNIMVIIYNNEMKLDEFWIEMFCNQQSIMIVKEEKKFLLIDLNLNEEYFLIKTLTDIQLMIKN